MEESLDDSGPLMSLENFQFDDSDDLDASFSNLSIAGECFLFNKYSNSHCDSIQSSFYNLCYKT